MTIYSDAVNNKFMGDCIWGNHNVAFPTTKFLQAHPYSGVSAELTALLTASGSASWLKFRNVLPQADFNSGAITKNLLTFGTNSDTIDDRYTFNSMNMFTLDLNGGANGTQVIMYDNNGYTPINNTFSRTNGILGLSNNVPFVASSTGGGNIYGNGFQAYTEFNSIIQCFGVADEESLALCFYQYNFTNNNLRIAFYYAGTLAEVNTEYNYYSNNITTKSILLCNQYSGGFYTTTPIGGAHRIGGAGKLTLQTGDAQYAIVCADGQNPTSQWATDMYVFDDNSALEFPAMGRVRNLLLAQGTYTIGKPVKIEPTAYPDAGFNRWLPVGTYAGKTVLMRCYSSVNI